jgi:hypothetical protein
MTVIGHRQSHLHHAELLLALPATSNPLSPVSRAIIAALRPLLPDSRSLHPDLCPLTYTCPASARFLTTYPLSAHFYPHFLLLFAQCLILQTFFALLSAFCPLFDCFLPILRTSTSSTPLQPTFRSLLPSFNPIDVCSRPPLPAFTLIQVIFNLYHFSPHRSDAIASEATCIGICRLLLKMSKNKLKELAGSNESTIISRIFGKSLTMNDMMGIQSTMACFNIMLRQQVLVSQIITRVNIRRIFALIMKHKEISFQRTGKSYGF